MTVLFIDAVGSVSTAERLRTEDHHRIVRETTELMSSAVREHEGTVTQFRGDGIMALFGAPVAHEDSARRAVSAALAMRDALDAYAEELRSRGFRASPYRIGLNTGPVIVGRIGSDDSMEYTAVGDTVNLAARMEQWARPGGIYITAQTARQVSSYFELRDLGDLEVKGKAEPIHAFEVVRELPRRTRLEVSIDRGLSPYVGRQRELALLRGLFDKAAESSGQAAFISGEAGIGKSRLLLELRRSLPADITWVEGHCASYGTRIPYLPIIDLVRTYLGVQEGDDDDEISRRVDMVVAEWGPSAAHCAVPLKRLLGIETGQLAETDPIARSANLISALKTLVAQASAKRTLVVVVEDLHWIDEVSEAAIAALVDVIASESVLFLFTHRPGYVPSFAGRTYCSRLGLQGFGPNDSERLVEQILGSPDLPLELRSTVTARAEGNPFFIEEVSRVLVESGAVRREDGRCVLVRPLDQVRIPETIEEVILTRIDRLEPAARNAVQLASVIGREFTARLLARIAEANIKLEGVLEELKSLELIYEHQQLPELSYMFKHALTHEVALSTLLSERRKLLHRLTARAIEELYAGRLSQHYEVLAHHYCEGEEWQSAVEYLVQSGDKAHHAYALNDAADFYHRAIAIIERGDALPEPSVPELRARIGTCFYLQGRWAEARDELLVGLSGTEGDNETRASRLLDLALACFWLQDNDSAQKYTTEGRAIAERLGASVQLITAEALEAGIEGAGGNVERSFDRFSRVMDTLDAREMPSVPPRLIDNYSLLAYWTGRTDSAIERARANTDLERKLGDFQNLMQGLPHLGVALAARGQYGEALSTFAEARAVGEKYGIKTLLARALCLSTGMLGDLYDFKNAEERSREAQEIARSAGFAPPVISSSLDLMFNYVRTGNLGKSEALIEQVGASIADASGWHGWLWSLRYSQALSEIALERGDIDEAMEHATATITQCREKIRPKYEALAHLTRGLALTRKERHDEARASFNEALVLARRLDDPALILRVTSAAIPTFADQEFVTAGQGAVDRILAELETGALRSAFEASDAVARLRH